MTEQIEDLFRFADVSWKNCIMQVLTVCRFDAEWAVRDVTGDSYGHSPDIRNVFETAQQMARRIGAHIEFSTEAESHYKDVMAGPSIDSAHYTAPNSASRFRAFVARFLRRGSGGNEANR